MNSTSINDLPTDPTGGGSIGGNINLIASEQPTHSDNPMQQSSLSLDQTTINQIINGLQQASVSGATNLPSRDIPRNTENLTQDAYIQPNHIPPSQNNNYIDNDETADSIIYKHNRDENTSKKLDSLYNEIQIPLLLIIMYFLFQLPFFKTMLFKHMPFLSNKDGNWNLNGLIFTSLLYGTIYYGLTKLITQMNNFI